MKKIMIRLVLIAALAASATVTGPASSASAFTGHHCTISTCRYFTSSYPTARYFYDRTTCNQWTSLSKAYLHGFRTKTALLNKFPHRKLHAPC